MKTRVTMKMTAVTTKIDDVTSTSLHASSFERDEHETPRYECTNAHDDTTNPTSP